MIRVGIFVDSDNFSYGIKALSPKFSLFKFDFEKFLELLSKNQNMAGFWFYTAPFKGTEEINLKWTELLSRLDKIDGKHVNICTRQKRTLKKEYDIRCRGCNSIVKVSGVVTCDKCKEEIYTGKRYSNKMDDVWLAVDMVMGARENKFDVAILISGDGDMIPAVDIVQSLGKKVHLVGFRGRSAQELVAKCDSVQYMKKNVIKRYHYHPERIVKKEEKK
ncbi:MAG: NYN domain-containing protein [Nanoarchaeota archaeon]|nr:NYN domain-containing protein [Nanoarchaeota archaeon]